MALIILALCIVTLILLITAFKTNPFIAFLLVSVSAGLLLKMPPQAVIASINKGIGDTLGSVTIIIVLGAMLGKLVALSGAAESIANRLKNIFGPQYLTYAMALTGFVVGIPLYYNVGFILLAPIIFSVSYSSRLPVVYVGLPMLAALSVMHGFIPPHPSPMTLIGIFHASIIKTFIYGLIVAIPAIILAGPVFASRLKKVGTIYPATSVSDNSKPLPGVLNSLLSSLLPVIIIIIASVVTSLADKNSTSFQLAHFIGDPVVAMLITIIVSTYTLGIRTQRSLKEVMACYTDSVKDIAMILLIIGSAGTLKQIFVDSKLSDEITALVVRCSLEPLALAWLVTAVLRTCLGSSTVAGLTAAGVLFPATQHTAINPELMVLSIGAGSLFGSHVNDTGFWLYKEYFKLSVRETFFSWTMMESLVSFLGLTGVLILNQLV
ncbi:gluconate:H+ symporter [Mucilaginibacter sp. RS28]|uniref:Gluconate:H+ symporter n=1 Tax=Mucilaginibacter straminoryzae TaxID=2932774 RepID=A0A9X1X107_9SPHI|nr:gluconate:H+ symporter [Mucilaginibacter straminoryzae]MCJ8209247.1 gluconate:H+ symporter [Mucilaginibacter straminoryzae]